MGFLPKEFEVPVLLETSRLRIRPITIHDLVKDYDAVMSSRDHLWAMFGEQWGWPPADLTLEQDLIDLGWHQKEFQRIRRGRQADPRRRGRRRHRRKGHTGRRHFRETATQRG